ncbi:hypothetical protein HETIRDRAFT_455144 [Heterobasidion irregulare TC 32-1]|uniref:Uncharacterized protein n=1 Tax=Heterobasidion irregulare (strain TC 32-1) TaxID=747525 RepID=W4JSW2_HETIT|nr:uncharacterized protein HETIRDRAFT_455144 [Heterobasidion irregulare TC 32-1]ETW76628.1 hypothetical protein HETIRDRAFT_455144 [Heterobasidion irregulare TC 32-1]
MLANHGRSEAQAGCRKCQNGRQRLRIRFRNEATLTAILIRQRASLAHTHTHTHAHILSLSLESARALPHALDPDIGRHTCDSEARATRRPRIRRHPDSRFPSVARRRAALCCALCAEKMEGGACQCVPQHRPPAALAPRPRETDQPPVPPAARPEIDSLSKGKAGTGWYKPPFGASLSIHDVRTHARPSCSQASRRRGCDMHGDAGARCPGSRGDPCSSLHGRAHGRRRTETGRNGGAGPREPPSRRGARRGSEDVHAARLEQRARARAGADGIWRALPPAPLPGSRGATSARGNRMEKQLGWGWGWMGMGMGSQIRMRIALCLARRTGVVRRACVRRGSIRCARDACEALLGGREPQDMQESLSMDS